MATITFSTLPVELHVNIANYCEKKDLINLCLTSKLVNERCLHVLYRHVDLRIDQCGNTVAEEYRLVLDARKKQNKFVRTLLSHPEYGKYVRFLKDMLYVPVSDEDLSPGEDVSYEEFWRVMQSLTHVQSVDVGSRNGFAQSTTAPTKQLPNNLFQSATSVRLLGYMQYALAKSILNVINPATLKHLCLDFVRDKNVGQLQDQYVPGVRYEDGRIITRGATSGLLTTLTGRCTALRTLELRRVGQFQNGHGWHVVADEESYIEWASFIRSVQGTLEHFTFEQARESARSIEYHDKYRTMDERFLRLVLPAIVSEGWPCLTYIELRGVRASNDLYSADELTAKLRAAVGEKAKIVIEEMAIYHVSASLWPTL